MTITMDWFADWRLQLRKRLLANDVEALRLDIKIAERQGEAERVGRLLSLRHNYAVSLRAMCQ